jgi:transcription initiation factor IIE alpha subunit
MSTEDSKTIIQLLQSLVIIELWRGGLSQEEIRKRLHISKTDVNKILRGVDREAIIKNDKNNKTKE